MRLILFLVLSFWFLHTHGPGQLTAGPTDVKDLVALVPGAKLAQYVGTRLAARALATVGNVGVWLWGNKGANPRSGLEFCERGSVADNSLGLLGIDANSAAPTVDIDSGL